MAWLHKIWREWRGFLVFVAVMLLFRSAIADWNGVPSGSMLPSILIGDRIVVDKIAYELRVPFTLHRIARWSEPARSDVVTFESPVDGTLLVKRVVGVPGDIVELRDNKLIVNGEAAQYSTAPFQNIPEALDPVRSQVDFFVERLHGAERTIMLHRGSGGPAINSFGPIEVPQGTYLMLGDNRDFSADSREIGFIQRDLILGKANSVAFSLDYDNYFVPRSNRFLRDLQ